MPHRMRATTSTDVALTEALEAMRSMGARPMWLPSAWGAKQMPRLPHGVVVRARIIDFLERGYFINEAARWLRELDVELTHEQGGNRPLQGPNGCGIAAGSACSVLAAAGPHWSAIWNANVSFAASCSVSVPSSGSNVARSLDETDVGRVLDAVRPPANGVAVHAGYLEWCSVVSVDQFCHVLINNINNIKTVGAGGDRVLKIAAVANQLSNGECLGIHRLGHPHSTTAVVTVVHPESC